MTLNDSVPNTDLKKKHPQIATLLTYTKNSKTEDNS